MYQHMDTMLVSSYIIYTSISIFIVVVVLTVIVLRTDEVLSVVEEKEF